MSASQRREAARYLLSAYQVSERRACMVCRLSRGTWHYQPQDDQQTALRQRIRDLALARVRYGYKRIDVLLKREGIHVNHKRVYRLYSQQGLQLRPKRPKRHVSAARRQPRPAVQVERTNEAWSMDFVSDQLQGGQGFRVLTVVDVHTRECLAAVPGSPLRGEHVVSALDVIRAREGAPERIYCDNGSEFTGRLVDLWAHHHKVELAFSRPGKPTGNAFIESFNGTFRDECLNVHWFSTLGDARSKITQWVGEYNGSRPHRALGNISPLEFKAQSAN